MQHHIFIESDCLLSAHILADALADLFCISFISDIVYPKSLLILFQHFVLHGTKEQSKSFHHLFLLCALLFIWLTFVYSLVSSFCLRVIHFVHVVVDVYSYFVRLTSLFLLVLNTRVQI